MHVAEFITTNPHGVQASESVRHASEVMAKHNVGAILVYEYTQLVGIVTDRDLVVRSLASGADADTETVRAVMTPHPVSVPRTTNADDALRLMVEHGIARLCVMDGGTVEGIITFSDLSSLAQLVTDGVAHKQPAPAYA